MSRLLKEFRQGVAESGLDVGHVGVRYPQALRELAVRYCREAEREGHSRRWAAEFLGVCDATLSRWLEEAEWVGAPGVETVALREVVLADSGGRGTLSVVTPEGFRVEGLGLSEVAAIVRALR